LSFDVAVYHTQFDEVAELADAFPDTRLILNHLGMIFGDGSSPAVREELRNEWRAGLQMLAQRSNVFCKLSGLGMPLWGFGFAGADPRAPVSALVDAWRPLVKCAIDIFGVDRCMTGSNYPIDAPTVTYADLWNALKIIFSDCSEEEKAAIFFDTAVSTYRIDVPVPVAEPDPLQSASRIQL
jgi:predicted TIM-barrel fold metal-dependent hydrolase